MFSRINLHGDEATIHLNLDVNGQPFCAAMPMRQQDGRWYSADLPEAVRRTHRQSLDNPAAAATRD